MMYLVMVETDQFMTSEELHEALCKAVYEGEKTDPTDRIADIKVIG